MLRRRRRAWYCYGKSSICDVGYRDHIYVGNLQK